MENDNMMRNKLSKNIIYWSLTELSIKRWTCVNKRKNSGSRWAWDNNIIRCPDSSSQLETRCRSESQRQTEGFGPSVTHGWATPSQDEKKMLLWSRGELGSILQSVLVSSSSHTHKKHHLFKNKVWEIYFLKGCIRSFIEVRISYLIMSLLIFVLWLYNKKKQTPNIQLNFLSVTYFSKYYFILKSIYYLCLIYLFIFFFFQYLSFKKLDGNYTRMLQAVLNKSRRQHPTKQQLYGHLPLIMKTIQIRQTRHAGHCWRSNDKLISDVLLWTPSHERAKVGWPARTYIQQLCANTGCSLEELPRAMDNRDRWQDGSRKSVLAAWCDDDL